MKTLIFRLSVALLLLFILLFALPKVSVYFSHATQTKAPGEIHSYWRKQIRMLGPESAYLKLQQETASTTLSNQHILGHVFGRELYKEKGLTAFSFCGIELGGGCIHEFMGTAIEERGLSVLTRLNQDCISEFREEIVVVCQHGLGHGLVSYFGYEDDKIAKALDACASTEGVNLIRGCYSGALMEFDSRTMRDSLLRPIGDAGPFELCEKLHDKYKPACYFWSPQYIWESLFDAGQTPEAFAGTGSYCEKVPSPYIDYCFQGLGNFVPPNANFEMDKSHELCNASSKIEHNRDTCFKEASGAL